jgi:hypothetical protein
MAEPVPFPQPEAPRQPLSGDTMLKTFAYAKQQALVSLTRVLEEAYTGEDRHDEVLRKHKIAAASILLGADIQDAYRVRRSLG